MSEQVNPLAKMREPFLAHQISKLPKETKKQRESREADMKLGVKCKVCGGWHHKDAVHLDYVGHAALTDRLLDVDPAWFWEPMAFTQDGLPLFDQTGGLWIRLFVCGMSRLGYGHAAGKPQMDPGSREKEVIGDALRNAAMRFGAALDLWHKGDLHINDDEDKSPPKDKPKGKTTDELMDDFIAEMMKNTTLEAVDAWAATNANAMAERFKGRDLDKMQAAFDNWRGKVSKPKSTAKPLADRAFMFEQALRGCADQAALRKTYESASVLRADLDRGDPERLVEINAIYEELYGAFDAPTTANEVFP